MKKPFFKDLSGIILILSNLAVIVLGIIQKWDFSQYFYIFIIQSLIIAFFFFIKTLLNNKLYFQKSKPPINFVGRLLSSIIIMTIIGFFYFLYLKAVTQLFLASGNTQFTFPIIPTLIFFGNHLFSFIYNFKNDQEKEKNYLYTVYTFVIRLIPIHVTIIIWGAMTVFGMFFLVIFQGKNADFNSLLSILSQIAAIVLLLAKTFFDYKTHNLEHKLIEDKEKYYNMDNDPVFAKSGK